MKYNMNKVSNIFKSKIKRKAKKSRKTIKIWKKIVKASNITIFFNNATMKEYINMGS